MADTGLEMKREAVFLDDLPALDPVIAHEITEQGWRGLTGHGEVLEVQSGAMASRSTCRKTTSWFGDKASRSAAAR